jgi:hypothetical protein
MIESLAKYTVDDRAIDVPGMSYDGKNFTFHEPVQEGEADGLPDTFENQASPLSTVEEYVRLSEREIRLLGEFAIVVGSNPRAIKRFVNVYKIVRGHEDLPCGESPMDTDLMIVMWLLALPTGSYKMLAASFQAFIEDPMNHDKSLNYFLTRADPVSAEFDAMRGNLSKETDSNEALVQLKEEPAFVFLKHCSFVGRFTF